MVSEEPKAATGAGSQEAPPTMECGKKKINPVVFDGQAGSRVADTENNDDLGEEAALPAENSKGKPGIYTVSEFEGSGTPWKLGLLAPAGPIRRIQASFEENIVCL